MKFQFATVALALLSASASAAHVRKESGVNVFSAPSWKVGSRVSTEDNVDVYVVLKNSAEGVKRLESELFAVSDPKSARYGQHLTIEEVKDVLSFNDEATKKVLSHISGNYKVHDLKVNRFGDIIKVSLPATEAESLFATELYQHTNVNAPSSVDTTLIRATKPYHVPEEIAEYVHIVEGLVRFPRLNFAPKVQEKKEKVSFSNLVGTDAEFTTCGAKCAGDTTPAVLQARYGYPTVNESDVASGNRMAVAEFQYQYWDTADLSAFQSACGLTNDVVVDVADSTGGNNESACKLPGSFCIESLLDIEYAKAVIGAIPLEVYYSGTFSLYDWAVTVNDDDQPAYVQSVSYGNDEIQQTSTDYMETTNTEFMKAGVRGVSILFASGDQGVWGRSGEASRNPVFNPDFPGGSPYITAVGGTDFATKSVIGDETAWNDSGGGFSNEFAAPSYQTAQVAGYFKNAAATLPNSSYYNAAGRGYPDISALGGQVNPYCVAYGGSGSKFGGVAGTSASAPVVAGVFTILNNVRLASGGAPLGFLNPWIYANPQAFNDVLTGDNSAGNSAGFEAAAGWDPVTGMGSPIFSEMQAAL